MKTRGQGSVALTRPDHVLANIGEVDHAHADRVDQARDGGQHVGEGSVGGELRENLTLGSCDPLRAFSVRDVRDTAAYQATASARQPHQAHFAGDLLPESVVQHPLVHLRLACERLLCIGAGELRGGRPVSLQRRTAFDCSHLE